MAEHKAFMRWERNGAVFTDLKYSREHIWKFDGGAVVPASPSPHNVKAPYSNAASVDPEEAFVAAIASCHLLTYLYLAAKEGFVVDRYEDDACGVITKNDAGVPWVSAVTLRPSIQYSGAKLPTAADEQRLHHAAHEQCFIANSVKTRITVEKP